MKSNCTVYIDESGDLGIKKGTRWFVITAVIADKQNEKELRDVISNLKNDLNLKTIHFKEIREFNKKLHIVSKLKDKQFTIINVIADTNILKLEDNNMTYNFLSKILLERVSWFLRDNNMIGDVIFSSRNTRRDNELTSYLKNKVLGYEWNEIVPGTIASVKSKKMESLDMLQLADICAASMFKSHEVDRFGFSYPCFMNNLKGQLYSYNGQHYSYGIKYYRNEMQPSGNYFEERYPCNIIQKNKKPPERT